MAQRIRAPAAAGALLLFILLASSARAAPARIEATDDQVFNPRYEPFELTVGPSETIEVVNTGSDRHTFTSVDMAWQELELAMGASGLVPAPTGEGDYRFYCRYHASARATPGEGMAGVLHVRAEPGNAQPVSAPAPALALGLAMLAAAALLARRRRRPGLKGPP